MKSYNTFPKLTKTRSDIHRVAADFGDYVAAQARDSKAETFSIFMSEVNDLIHELVKSTQVQDTISGVKVISMYDAYRAALTA